MVPLCRASTAVPHLHVAPDSSGADASRKRVEVYAVEKHHRLRGGREDQEVHEYHGLTKNFQRLPRCPSVPRRGREGRDPGAGGEQGGKRICQNLASSESSSSPQSQQQRVPCEGEWPTVRGCGAPLAALPSWLPHRVKADGTGLTPPRPGQRPTETFTPTSKGSRPGQRRPCHVHEPRLRKKPSSGPSGQIHPSRQFLLI